MATYGAARSRGTGPVDRPRRPGEHPIVWAAATGRIPASRIEFWTAEYAANRAVTTRVLEALAPGCAVPLTRAGSLDTVAAAARRQPKAVAEPEHDEDPREVAAAASVVDDEPADPGDDRLFGHSDAERLERHLERLTAIAAGNSVVAPLSQRAARERLERYAAGGRVAAAVPGDGLPASSRIPVPAGAAQRWLDRLNAQTEVRWSR